MNDKLYRLGCLLIRLSGYDGRCKTTYYDIPTGMQCQLPLGHGGNHRSGVADAVAHTPVGSSMNPHTYAEQGNPDGALT
jgi:hypothetical protein